MELVAGCFLFLEGTEGRFAFSAGLIIFVFERLLMVSRFFNACLANLADRLAALRAAFHAFFADLNRPFAFTAIRIFTSAARVALAAFNSASRTRAATLGGAGVFFMPTGVKEKLPVGKA